MCAFSTVKRHTHKASARYASPAHPTHNVKTTHASMAQDYQDGKRKSAVFRKEMPKDQPEKIPNPVIHKGPVSCPCPDELRRESLMSPPNWTKWHIRVSGSRRKGEEAGLGVSHERQAAVGVKATMMVTGRLQHTVVQTQGRRVRGRRVGWGKGRRRRHNIMPMPAMLKACVTGFTNCHQRKRTRIDGVRDVLGESHSQQKKNQRNAGYAIITVFTAVSACLYATPVSNQPVNKYAATRMAGMSCPCLQSVLYVHLSIQPTGKTAGRVPEAPAPL